MTDAIQKREDYATVAASYDYGILASNAWISGISVWGNLLLTLRGTRRKVTEMVFDLLAARMA